MSINMAVEVENKIRTIKVSVKPASGSRHPRTFVGILGGYPSIQISILGIIFQDEYNNYMVAEAL